MELKKNEDAALLARLNQPVHELHHLAYPEIFKPYDYLETLDLFQKLVNQPEHYLLVAEEDGQDIGYVWGQVITLYETPFRYGQKSFYIHQIAIEPTFQGKGYGHQMMYEIEQIACNQGCDTVELDYWIKNDGVGLFYDKEGYEVLRKSCRKKI